MAKRTQIQEGAQLGGSGGPSEAVATPSVASDSSGWQDASQPHALQVLPQATSLVPHLTTVPVPEEYVHETIYNMDVYSKAQQLYGLTDLKQIEILIETQLRSGALDSSLRSMLPPELQAAFPAAAAPPAPVPPPSACAAPPNVFTFGPKPVPVVTAPSAPSARRRKTSIPPLARTVPEMEMMNEEDRKLQELIDKRDRRLRQEKLAAAQTGQTLPPPPPMPGWCGAPPSAVGAATSYAAAAAPPPPFCPSAGAEPTVPTPAEIEWQDVPKMPRLPGWKARMTPPPPGMEPTAMPGNQWCQHPVCQEVSNQYGRTWTCQRCGTRLHLGFKGKRQLTRQFPPVPPNK